MGIPGGASLFYKTQKLTLDQALLVVQRLKKEKEGAAADEQAMTENSTIDTNDNTASRLTIPIDGNLVAYKFIGSKSPFGPAEGVFRVAEGLSQKLVNAPVFVDGDTRHPSKRSA